MRDAYAFHRMRKYRRKKFGRSDPQALKYWRYHFRWFGPHRPLWALQD